MKSTLILLLAFITFSVAAQHSYIPSERIFNTKDGLLSNKIHAIHKDASGFMWIGTENGLNRFDGHTFEAFTTASHPKMTIERIQTIVEDDAGFLWLLEPNETFEHSYESPEVNLFNIHTGEFSTLEERFGDDLPFEVKDIRYMQQLSDGSIFIYDLNKAFFYTQKDGFTSMPIPKKIIGMSGVQLQKDGQLLVEGAYDDMEIVLIQWAIFKINKNGKILAERKARLKLPFKDNSTRQSLFLAESRNNYNGSHLDAFNLFASVLDNPHLQPTTDINAIIHTVWNKEQELLWLKSQDAISVIQPSGKIIYQMNTSMDFGGFPIFFDGTTTWMSDQQNGLKVITLQPNYFKTYQVHENEFSNSARGVFAAENGQKWMSTIGGPVKLDAKDNRLAVPLTVAMFTPFLNNNNNNKLWFWEKGMLSSEDLVTGKKQYYPHPTDYRINVWSLFQSKSDEIWVCNAKGKIYTLQPSTGQWKVNSTLPIKEKVEFNAYHIEQRDAQSVWICSNQGLFVVNNQGEYIAHYSKEQKGEFYLPATDFHHLYQDNDGVIWLATGDGGLLEYRISNSSHEARPSNNEYRMTKVNHYTTNNGLSCNVLHAIYEDDYEYLWISSNDGLMQMDKRTGKIVTYTVEDGLLHNEFNRISHFQKADGTIYFGGVTGVISFHPKHFSKVRSQKNGAELVVTNFQQFSGQRGQFEDLTYKLLNNASIRLKPTDRFFKLNLALLNYKDGTIFKYRIKGLYDWQTTTNTELSVSGLPYGTHQLEVKAFNTNQQEAANTLTYSVYVLRPFYLQWWFMFLVLAILGTSTFYFIKWRTQQLLVFQETEQLRNMDKMKSRFFANISHELRTPITLILAPLSQLIKNHTQQTAEATTQQLLNIKANGQNLLNLVNEVLDLSKLEADKLELHLVPTKIPQFIERVVANFESAAAVKSIEYQMMSFLQKDVTALFDQSKLEKILNNLLSNALKFTPKNGSIQIMVAQVEQDLVIKVKDSGRGIPAADLPYVFDRYFQTQSKSIEGGTGIGLALTKELVELMKGEVSVKSELGEGTEFEIKLPIELVENEELTIIQEKDESLRLLNFQSLVNVQETKISKEKDTILLVEDNPSLQQFIQSVLTPYYNVIVTGNGVEALSQLPTANCQLILSDVMMPEMDGFTLLEKVKSNDKFCSIPFILLTARADMNDKLRGLRIGVDDYMTKPFDVDELLLRIKNLIANSKNRIIETIEEVQLKEKTNVLEQKTTKTQATNHQSLITSHDLNWLEQVENIIKREMRNKQFKIEDMANELFISRRQFARKVKQITGLTPSAYMRSIRLQEARTIFEAQESYTVSEVSFSVGFENVSYFTKLYQEAYGKHPQDYLVKV